MIASAWLSTLGDMQPQKHLNNGFFLTDTLLLVIIACNVCTLRYLDCLEMGIREILAVDANSAASPLQPEPYR